MMHPLVEDVDRWWAHVQTERIADKYGVRVSPPEQRPWGLRDFLLVDPSGVLWRVAQNTAQSLADSFVCSCGWIREAIRESAPISASVGRSSP